MHLAFRTPPRGERSNGFGESTIDVFTMGDLEGCPGVRFLDRVAARALFHGGFRFDVSDGPRGQILAPECDPVTVPGVVGRHHNRSLQ